MKTVLLVQIKQNSHDKEVNSAVVVVVGS